MSIAIVTDTACHLTPEEAEELGIFLLPIELIIDEVSYKDGIEITNDEFYKKMAMAEKTVKTSQPVMGDVYALYETLSKEYDEILSIHLGSNVSGTVQSLQLITEDVPEYNVTVYDTQLVSIPAGYLVREAKKLVDQGKDVATIVNHLDALRNKSIAYASIHSLDNLVESGRFPSIVGKVAKMAKIKPIIAIKASEKKGLDVVEKVRTSKRVNAKLIELIKEYTDQLDYPFIVDVAHGNYLEEAEEVRNQLQVVFPEHEINMHVLTSVIGAHSGPEIIAIFVAPDL